MVEWMLQRASVDCIARIRQNTCLLFTTQSNHALRPHSDPNFNVDYSISRILFYILLFFSGIWPHLKLLCVHALWYVPCDSKYRSSVLWWLDYFGKFSMADVFITLCMISYLRLSAEVISSSQVAENVFDGLPLFIENSTNATALVAAICKIAGSAIPSCPDFLGEIVENPEELSGFLVSAHRDYEL